MSKYIYGWEKLYKTMRSLVSDGDIRDRLYNGLVNEGIHITPERDLPEEIREDFLNFLERMSPSQSSIGRTSLKTTIFALSDEEAYNGAQQLLDFYDTVCRHFDD